MINYLLQGRSFLHKSFYYILKEDVREHDLSSDFEVIIRPPPTLSSDQREVSDSDSDYDFDHDHYHDYDYYHDHDHDYDYDPDVSWICCK